MPIVFSIGDFPLRVCIKALLVDSSVFKRFMADLVSKGKGNRNTGLPVIQTVGKGVALLQRRGNKYGSDTPLALLASAKALHRRGIATVVLYQNRQILIGKYCWAGGAGRNQKIHFHRGRKRPGLGGSIKFVHPN